MTEMIDELEAAKKEIDLLYELVESAYIEGWLASSRDCRYDTRCDPHNCFETSKSRRKRSPFFREIDADLEDKAND